MKQTFELPDNTSAMHFVTFGASVNEVPQDSLLKDEEGYQNVDSLEFHHHLINTNNPAPIFVVVAKGRYQLPQSIEILDPASESIDEIVSKRQVPVLRADVSASEIYLLDEYEHEPFHDHDLAVSKQHADVIVKKFNQINVPNQAVIEAKSCEYQVYLDNQLWLHRPIGKNEPATFDWCPRMKGGRELTEQLSQATLSLRSNDRFNQGSHSRYFKMDDAVGILVGGEVVQLTRKTQINQTKHLTSYRFTLPKTGPVAQYYYFCGKGKDESSQWCCANISLVIDTLEIFPDQGYIDIVWRGHWIDEAISVSQYRELKLMVNKLSNKMELKHG